MVFHSLLNPGSTPFKIEMRRENVGRAQALDFIKKMIMSGNQPEPCPKYASCHNASWKALYEASIDCLQLDPNKRTTLKNVMETLSHENQDVVVKSESDSESESESQSESELEDEEINDTGNSSVWVNRYSLFLSFFLRYYNMFDMDRKCLRYEQKNYLDEIHPFHRFL